MPLWAKLPIPSDWFLVNIDHVSTTLPDCMFKKFFNKKKAILWQSTKTFA